MPLFNRGSLRAETVRAEAFLNEQLEAYRETVLLAIEEADNALITESRKLNALRFSHASITRPSKPIKKP